MLALEWTVAGLVSRGQGVCVCEHVVVVLCERVPRSEEITREEYARRAGDWWRLVRRDACGEVGREIRWRCRAGERRRDRASGLGGEIARVDWAWMRWRDWVCRLGGRDWAMKRGLKIGRGDWAGRLGLTIGDEVPSFGGSVRLLACSTHAGLPGSMLARGGGGCLELCLQGGA